MVFGSLEFYEFQWKDQRTSIASPTKSSSQQYRVGIRDEYSSENSPLIDAEEIEWMPKKY